MMLVIFVYMLMLRKHAEELILGHGYKNYEAITMLI